MRPTLLATALIASVGLSAVLAGNKKLEEVIQASRTAGLDILPCGEIPANPSEILNSEQFAATLKTLGEKYDLLVIDSPPMGPVTDAFTAKSADSTPTPWVRASKISLALRKASNSSRNLP